MQETIKKRAVIRKQQTVVHKLHELKRELKRMDKDWNFVLAFDDPTHSTNKVNAIKMAGKILGSSKNFIWAKDSSMKAILCSSNSIKRELLKIRRKLKYF